MKKSNKDPQILSQQAKQEESEMQRDILANQEEHRQKTEALQKEAEEKTPQTYSHEELLEALYWIFAIFERANMKMILIKETGKAVHTRNRLTGDGVHLAARRLEWDSGSKGIIDAMAAYAEETPDKVTYVANNGVPVYVNLCEDDYCISSPDTMLYENEYFLLPNPFERFAQVYPNV